MRESDISAAGACRPVDWAPYAHLFPDEGEPTIYPGSVVEDCTACDMPIYVGPEMQELRADSPYRVIVLCFICAALWAAAQHQDRGVVITDLGNTFKRHPQG